MVFGFQNVQLVPKVDGVPAWLESKVTSGTFSIPLYLSDYLARISYSNYMIWNIFGNNTSSANGVESV